MSLSTIDQSTGNPTLVAGNVNDKVGNMAALTTTDKSSAVGAINEVKSGLTGKTDYVDMSVPAISGSAADAAGTVFDNLTITDRIVNGRYNNSGMWMFTAYKYSGDVAYGTLIAFRFDGYALFLSVNNGTKTVKLFSFNT